MPSQKNTLFKFIVWYLLIST